MQRKLVFIIVFLALITGITGVVWAAPGIVVDGRPFSYAVDPQIKNDRLIVPMYAFAREMGYSIEHNTDDNSYVFVPLYRKDGKVQLKDLPVTEISGTAMAPVRMLVEAMGASVVWNPVFDVATVTNSQDIQDVAAAVNGTSPDLWFYENPTIYSDLPGTKLEVPVLLYNTGCTTKTTVRARWEGTDGDSVYSEEVSIPRYSCVQISIPVKVPDFDQSDRLLVTANPDGIQPNNELNRENNSTLIKILPYDNRKKIALTFDDAPDDQYTEQALDILKEYDVKATFFMLGINVETYPEVARRVADEGHEVGNHSYNHPDFSGMSAEAAYNKEIERTEEIFYNTMGIHSTIFRPPYGSITSSEKKYFNEKGFSVVMWDIDTRDWDVKVNTPEHITNEILNNATDNCIVLMHTGGGNRANTIKALPQILSQLKAKNYRLCTVSEILEAEAMEE